MSSLQCHDMRGIMQLHKSFRFADNKEKEKLMLGSGQGYHSPFLLSPSPKPVNEEKREISGKREDINRGPFFI